MRRLLSSISSADLRLASLSRRNPRCSHNPRRLHAIAVSRTYDDAITLLNTLQTPYKILKEREAAGIQINGLANQHLRTCLAQIGHSQSDLDKLNIIHVAGTKGKGTTCAYVDSILAQYRKSHDVPHKVGLFTSPHLVAVRERIRINSVPIPAQLFTKYFFEVWDSLQAAAAGPLTPPSYFKYLTLMSYHVFLQESVDTAVYEVGVGGEYDATNIVDHPTVTGISTLGIDHVVTLGAKVEEIAWHKAGIQKPGAPSFTVKQIPTAMKVIKRRAKERNVESLQVVDLDTRLDKVKIRPDAEFQRSNASLAIALADAALRKLDSTFQLPTNSLPKEFVNGLEQSVWRGRCEKKVEGNIAWHLDGAHTADSIKVACRWFGEECSRREGSRVLIFNQQGNRAAIPLLEGLYFNITSHGLVKFDHVIFCTSTGQQKDSANAGNDSTAIADLTHQKAFAKKWQSLDPSPNTTIKVLPRIEDALEYVRGLNLRTNEDGDGRMETQVLITGSVHLVGRALGALEGDDAL